ncbi:rho guanine nucleotide exchange factor 19-like [Brachionus plicatilis]|uniref:Rho guanine nucleotide exchange factor 19-like n=1 Tax=Brachionus plicatilis TaxID=10195 RepID=A0A3M7SF55_BRAPC|nr:rho guanine nucleotide exchange factor 19-like [Brachionus plicatilis]
MFSRKKKPYVFNETLSPEMLSRSKESSDAKKNYFLKREKQNINSTSYIYETGTRLKKSAIKLRSKSRSALDEEDEDNYFREKNDEKFGERLREKTSNLRKKLLGHSKSQLNQETPNYDQATSNFDLNFSTELLDLPNDSNDQENDSNLKSNSSKSTLFVKFFQKSESQPVSRKNSENDKNLSSSKLTRMSLPSKFAKNGTFSNLSESSGYFGILDNFKLFDFIDDEDLEKYVKPNSVILWSGQKTVIDSGLLSQMNKKEIELQERWFEIYTSEISYYKSLKILDQIILTAFEKNLKIQDFNLVLITNLKEIISISEKVILALNARIKSSLIIENLFDILKEAIMDEKFQKAYIDYAGEKSTQKENYDNLRKNNKKFDYVIQKLSYNPVLEGKDVQTYFIKPIQRLSRYKLLADAILTILPKDSPHIEEGKNLSILMNKILKKANRKAAETLNFSEAVKLLFLLKFQNNEIKLHQLFQNRELIYHNDLLSVKCVFMIKKEDLQSSLKRNKNSESQSQQFSMYHVILLTDLLFICKKEESQGGSFFYKVVLKADKSQVHLEMCEWEELNDDGSNQENKESASRLYLLIFTIQENVRASTIARMLNKKYLFVCSKQEGEIWLKHFENYCSNFERESDEEENFT